jgi:AraC-like DNA-binding protein
MVGTLAATSGVATIDRLLGVLPAFGVDGDDVCRAVGLDLEEARRNGRLLVAVETALWEEAAARLPALPLGVVAAERCFEEGYHESTLYEYIGCFAPTLRDAAMAMRARQRLETDGFVTSFQESSGRCVVRTEEVHPGVTVSMDRVEFGMVRMLKEARRLTSSRLTPSLVRLRRTRTPHLAHYRRAFDAPIELGAECDTMIFPVECLDAPLLRSNPPLHAELVRIADNELAAMAPTDLWTMVLSALERSLSEGDLSVRGIARRMGLPSEALHRLVRDRGQLWIEVVDGVRRPIAERLLRDLSMPIAAIGYRVGFANPASFTRAFRRWTGRTPEDYRRSA